MNYLLLFLYAHRLGPLTNTWCMRMEAKLNLVILRILLYQLLIGTKS